MHYLRHTNRLLSLADAKLYLFGMPYAIGICFFTVALNLKNSFGFLKLLDEIVCLFSFVILLFSLLRISGSVANRCNSLCFISTLSRIRLMTINFSGRHFPQDIIMRALRYYLAYKLSYREIEEIFAERNIHFDHSTLNRWVIKYAPQLEAMFRLKKRKVSGSWRMDETYIKVKGQWVYYYRAVDKYGKVVGFYLSKNRDEPATRAFFNKAINNNGLPDKVVIDKSGANAAALDTVNIRLWLSDYMLLMIEV